MARLLVELEVDVPRTDPPTVRGTVRDPDGADATFVGWVGLLALLQQALSEPEGSGPPISSDSARSASQKGLAGRGSRR